MPPDELLQAILAAAGDDMICYLRPRRSDRRPPRAAELSRLGQLLGDSATDDCPFTPAPSAFVVRTAHWCARRLWPKSPSEWTNEGILRHPSYIALRDDKDPRVVVRET